MKVTIVNEDITEHTIPNCGLVSFLMSYYSEFPDSAKIFCNGKDITPVTEDDIIYLESISDDVTVTVYPGVAAIVAAFAYVGVTVTASAVVSALIQIAISVAIMGIQMALAPGTPEAANTRYESPNNGLGARLNNHNMSGRVPDNYGRNFIVPSLISRPYTVYLDNEEVEHNTMCIGRGSYLIHSVKDDTTDISQISKAAISIYDPFMSPNNSTPAYSIGNPITDKLSIVKRHNSLNGQTLRPANEMFINGQNDVWLVSPNEIRTTVHDFQVKFEAGDSLTITSGTFGAVNYDGTYIIASVGSGSIVLNNPQLINPNWSTLVRSSAMGSPSLRTTSDKWIGYYNVTDKDCDQLIFNVVAAAGLYKTDGINQKSVSVDVLVEFELLNDSLIPTGATFTTPNAALIGSSISKEQRAISVRVTNPYKGSNFRFRLRRVSLTDDTFQGQVVDEVKIKDVLLVTYVNKSHFGDVTIAQIVTTATPGALAVKDRKIIVECSRLINGIPTSDIGDIIIDVATDKYIGNLTEDEIDIPGIREAVNELKTYFKDNSVVSFNHSIDVDGLSFEEILNGICASSHCIPLRAANKVSIRANLPTNPALVLFNHRNIVPDSDITTIRFGKVDNFDGVEITYKDHTGIATTYYLPENRTALTPKKLDIWGLTTEKQAYIHAWREYNKLRYQYKQVEFTGLHEASCLIMNDKIIVADNSQYSTQDGEVIGQDGLIIELSQDVIVSSGDYIFLQNPNGSIESIELSSQVSGNMVLLASSPTFPLQVNRENYARTTYIISKPSNIEYSTFVVTSKEYDSLYTSKITALNFDTKIYLQDFDYG